MIAQFSPSAANCAAQGIPTWMAFEKFVVKLYEKAKSSSSMAQPALIIIYPSRIMHLFGTAY